MTVKQSITIVYFFLGQSFIGVLKANFSGFERLFSLHSSITSSCALTMWSEVPGQLGLVYCVQQNTGNVIVLAIKTDVVYVQEIKSSSKNIKIQNAVCYYCAPIKQKQEEQTTMLMLLDDGSLRICNGNKDIVPFINRQPPRFVKHLFWLLSVFS